MRCFFLLFLLIGCSSIKPIECPEGKQTLYVGNGTPIYSYNAGSGNISEQTQHLPTSSDTITTSIEVTECADYDGDSHYLFTYNNSKWLILKDLAFKNQQDAIEFAKSISSESYVPKYSSGVSRSVLTGPRGGKYTISPSGKKIYESS